MRPFPFATLLVVLVVAGLVAAAADGGRTGSRSGAVVKTAFSGGSSHEHALGVDEVKSSLHAVGIRNVLIGVYKHGPSGGQHVLILGGPPLGANFVSVSVFLTVLAAKKPPLGALDVRVCNVWVSMTLPPFGSKDSARDARAAEQTQERIASELRRQCVS